MIVDQRRWDVVLWDGRTTIAGRTLSSTTVAPNLHQLRLLLSGYPHTRRSQTFRKSNCTSWAFFSGRSWLGYKNVPCNSTAPPICWRIVANRIKSEHVSGSQICADAANSGIVILQLNQGVGGSVSVMKAGWRAREV